MNRKTFASLSVGLGMTLLVMGSQPLAASDTPYAPLGITETPVATETSTNTPPAPTNTPTPTKALTQSPANTAVPATPTPTVTPVSTPTATRVLVLPVAGAPAAPVEGLPWVPAMLGLILGGLAALAIGSDPRANHTPHH